MELVVVAADEAADQEDRSAFGEDEIGPVACEGIHNLAEGTILEARRMECQESLGLVGILADQNVDSEEDMGRDTVGVVEIEGVAVVVVVVFASVVPAAESPVESALVLLALQ